MATRMGLSLNDLVLDLGAGIGGPGRDITSAIGCKVVGLNLSAAQLRSLQNISVHTGSTYTQVVQGDMGQLPFLGEVFDGAISINSLYHVPHPEQAITEIARTLRPVGKFGLDDWFTTNRTHIESLHRLRHNWSTPPEGFHSVETITHALEDADLSIIHVADFTEEAGRFLTEDRFGKTFDIQIAPVLAAAFPTLYQYDGYRHEHAQQAVSQLKQDALYMGELYRNRQAAYLQIVAQKA